MTNEKETTVPEKANWTEQKVRLKARFENLTDTDLQFEEGKKEEMLVRIQNKIGKSKEELFKIMASR